MEAQPLTALSLHVLRKFVRASMRDSKGKSKKVKGKRKAETAFIKLLYAALLPFYFYLLPFTFLLLPFVSTRQERHNDCA